MFGKSTTREDDAQPDFYACGFWGGRTEDAFFDVRVVNPNALSYRCLELSSCYRRAEKEKEQKHRERVREIEHASFTPLTFSTAGGASRLTTTFLNRLASQLAEKRDIPYTITMAWLRCRIVFSLLRSAILCLRGSHRTAKRCDDDDFQPDFAAHQAQL